MTNTTPYGQGDATFQAVGGEAGMRNSSIIFTTSWLPRLPIGVSTTSVPRRYQEKYGPVRIPGAHQHLAITAVECGLWPGCMGEALARQGYPQELRQYLQEQFCIPVEAIRHTCELELPATT